MIRKYLLTLLILTGLAFSGAYSQQSVVYHENGQFQIRDNSYLGFSLKTITGTISAFQVKTNAGNFTEISIPDYGFSMNEGAPKLPVLKQLIEVPLKAGIQINITNAEYQDKKLADYGFENHIIPAQPPLSKGIDIPEDVPFIWDQSLYLKNEFLGGDLIFTEEAGQLRGIRMFNFQVAPVKYNPVTHVIRVYTRIEAEIIFTNPDIQSTLLEKQRVYSPFFENNYNRMANYKPLETDELITSAPVTMVIVSDIMFQNTLQPFINWKKKKGFKIIEGYTNNPNIGTTTTTIKSYLQGLYQSPPSGYNVPTFVLLVGDVAQIPAFTGTAGSHPTDLYYMEYTGDKIPEVYYGRFSATNVSELQPQIDKTLQYEQYLMPDPSFLDKAIIVAGADASHQLTWGNGQVNYGTNNYFNLAHGITASAYLQPLPSGSATLIKAGVSAGAGFVNYSAHCSSSGWADPSFTNSDVPNLQNINKYHLMVSNCCLSAKFNDAACFGETLMRAVNKGALGYIGGSNNTYWDEDYWWAVGFKTVSANPTYDATKLGAFDRTFHDHGEATSQWYITQGQMTVGGNLAVQQSSTSLKTYYWEIYHLFGDPSLMIYYSQPDATTASYQALMPLGSTTFEVNTQPYAYVAISKDNVLHGAAIANSNGLAVVSLTPITVPGTANIVVTRQNGQPYIGTVTVASPAGAYVLLDSYSINDDQGNQNGQVDAGETISLDVSLKNLGNATAYNIQAELSMVDEFISISDDLQNWPEIPVNQTSLQENAFTFEVSPMVPDQHVAVFTITVTSGTETWVSVFNITINAPLLSMGSMTIADGNDGILYPGETANMKFTIQNIGSSSIINAKGILTSTHPLFYISYDTITIGNLNPGKSFQVSFLVTAAQEMLLNSIVPLSLQIIADNAGGSKSYQTIIGAKTSETFETGNFSQFAWQNGGSASWTVVNTGSYQGTYCAKSGLITHNQISDLSLSAEILTNDSIVFYYKVSSESTYDFLRFYIDNVEKAQWSGTVGYARAAFFVNQGQRTFKWSYTKDVSVNTGSDCAWIDNIRFPLLMPATAPVASFMADLTSVNTNQPVQFYDISAGNVSNRSWSFPGGNPSVSSELNPVVAYAEPGNYPVSLTVSNTSGSNTKNVADYINVSVQMLQQQINIPEGWSGISSCLFPVPDDIETVLEPIMQQLILIQNMDEVWWPGILQSLETWDSNDGFKIKVSQDVTLIISGTEIFDRTVSLIQGWNLIPVVSVCNAIAETLFEPVLPNLLIVKEVAGPGIYWPAFGINTLTVLEPGKSYFVYMLQPGIIEFPPACPNGDEEPVKKAQKNIESPWAIPQFTPGGHVIGFSEQAVQVLLPNDVVGVFDEAGKCLGQQIFEGQAFTVTAISNDPLTSISDGFEDDDQFFLKVFRPATSGQYELIPTFDENYGRDLFVTHGLSVVKSLELLTSVDENENMDQFQLSPNPVMDQINFTGNFHATQLTIFTPSGNQIMNIMSDAGIRSLNVERLPKGVYIIKATSGDKIVHTKFIKN